MIATPDDAKQLLIPVVGSKRTKIYPQAIHEVATTIHDKPIIAGVIGPFSLAGRLMGMTEIMMNCYDESEMVHIVLDKVKQFIIEYINEFKKLVLMVFSWQNQQQVFYLPLYVKNFHPISWVPFVKKLKLTILSLSITIVGMYYHYSRES
jgi:hypothetical protein